jgi:hypothetical protein
MDGSKLAGIAALGALAAIAWLAFVHRGPERVALATILTKGYVAASTYTQQPIGADRGFRTPTSIPIAESYAFELELDGVSDPVRASFNAVKSRQFDVGQRVRVQYARRGIPPFWQRITVVDMMPLGTPY